MSRRTSRSSKPVETGRVALIRYIALGGNEMRRVRAAGR